MVLSWLLLGERYGRRNLKVQTGIPPAPSPSPQAWGRETLGAILGSNGGHLEHTIEQVLTMEQPAAPSASASPSSPPPPTTTIA